MIIAHSSSVLIDRQIESSLQVKQFLSDTRELLAQMLKIVNIKEQYLVTMSSVADISYGFQLIDEYIPLMQDRIKRYGYVENAK